MLAGGAHFARDRRFVDALVFTEVALGFRVQGSEFRVQGAGFRVQGLGFKV